MSMSRLSSLSKGSGCGCKIPAAELSKILGDKASENFPGLIIGSETFDDAAVLDLGDGRALISTTDFFTPIVDDPFDFGCIAAANAINDVYAMGGKPILALAILAWPTDKLPLEDAGKVLEGARSICAKAGIPLAGGHSININEPVFGLAVNGIIKKDRITRNNGAKENDLLFLTKPLGTGILSAAFKRGAAGEEDILTAVSNMKKLNSIGAELSEIEGVNAVTDITGFGLLGHLIEMAEGSNVSAELDFTKIPILEKLETYLGQNIVPDNTYRNWNSYEKKVSGIQSVMAFQILCDPQSSGGLLISASGSALENIKELFIKNSLQDHLEPIGKMIAPAGAIVLVQE